MSPTSSKIKSALMLLLALTACKSFWGKPTIGPLSTTSLEHHSSLPMPTGVQSWHIEALVASHEQPDRESLDRCVTMIDGLGSEIRNEEDLIHIKTKLLSIMSEPLAVYHWCFFRLLQNLDLTLQKDSISFEDRGKYFFAEMIKLWVLSRALDTRETTEDYFTFLKKRYIEISKQVFGRDVTTIGESWDLWPHHSVPISNKE